VWRAAAVPSRARPFSGIPFSSGKIDRSSVAHPFLLAALLPAAAAAAANPAAAFERALAAAEARLQRQDLPGAEAQYRTALREGWLLLGTIERVEGRLPQARDAFRAAGLDGGDEPRVQRALAVAHLQMGEPAEAEAILAPLVKGNARDADTRRLMAQALLARGQAAAAARELEAARAAAPADLETLFALACARLAEGRADAADTLFRQLARARPLPQTRLLIGRAYRDAGHYERARAELRAALKLSPRIRYAHYYLGMVAARQGERAALAEAIDEFRAELALAPDDPLANLELGVALAESQRCEEALPALEVAARGAPPHARTLYYLGRCQLAQGRGADAAASLGRALELARAHGANAPALRAIHTQLGQALRAAGRTEEAAPHFAESARLSAEGTEAERENLARYMADAADPAGVRMPAVMLVEPSPLASVPSAPRQELAGRVRAGLAGAYLNLGVMAAQREEFPRAATLLEKAAALQPGLERVQYSLGVAYFNARDFAKATGPLARAFAEQPALPGLRSMLAMAWLESGGFAQAADLLRDDPARASDAALQFAYGLALARSGRAPEAEEVFSRLLSQHGDSPELSVMLGQAHAQQGDYPAAVEALTRALRLRPGVAEASATLGLIYLKQGKLDEAEAALRAELSAHPQDVGAQQNLAIVLDTLHRRAEAIEVLKRLLAAKPDAAEARYLLGKALLAEGAAQDALPHLESAAQASPEDPSVRYQLGQAYQRLGKADLAEREFEAFRKLKEASRN
jgi:tetratricopeptide (TPR) repeat protein